MVSPYETCRTLSNTNICIMGVPEKGRERGTRRIFEKIMTNMYMNLHIQQTQGILSRINSKTSTPRHNIIKLFKVKDGILKATREKWLFMHLSKIRVRISLRLKLISYQKPWRPEDTGITESKYWKKKTKQNNLKFWTKNSISRKLSLKVKKNAKLP